MSELAPDARQRLDKWSRELLDLTLRNRLLNHTVGSKRHAALLVPDTAAFENQLADGAGFEIVSLEDARHPEEDDAAAIRRAGAAGQVLVDGDGKQLTRSLELMRRLGRTSLEEGGANILYLAVGFLEWYEAESSSRPLRAPLLLMPVTLERPTTRHAFALRLADEDVYGNVSLVEKLRHDFGFDLSVLRNPPEDESGFDIPALLGSIAQTVADRPRWKVHDELVLGIYSFRKYLMWLDLTSRGAELLENPIVQHIVSRGAVASYGPQTPFPSPESLDTERRAKDTFCPRDADSSQLAAVHAAADGHTFVLQGPPGTGKSQTITNIIAHCLTVGKRVLFVSEKMAALEVVKARLDQANLGPFCLELHSDRATRTHVLEQLGQALRVKHPDEPGDWAPTSAQVESLRADLNGYSRAMSRPNDLGLTLHEAMSRLLGVLDAPRVELALPAVGATDRAGLLQFRTAVDRFATAAAIVRSPAAHPWRSCQLRTWNPTTPERADSALAALAAAAQSVGASPAAFSVTEASLDELRALAAAIRVALDAPDFPPRLLAAADEDRAALESLAATGSEYEQLTSELGTHWEPDKLGELDLVGLRTRFQTWGHTFFLFAFFALWTANSALRTALRAGGKLPRDIIANLQLALRRKELNARLEQADATARALLGARWQRERTQWAELEQVSAWASRFDAALRQLEAASGKGHVAGVRAVTVAPGAEARGLADAVDGLVEQLEAVTVQLQLKSEPTWGAPGRRGALAAIDNRARLLRESVGQLRDWSDLLQKSDELGAGLRGLSDAFLAGTVPAAHLPRAFERAFLSAWVIQKIHADPALNAFRGAEHARKIAAFQTSDLTHIELSKRLTFSRLARRVPSLGVHAAGDSEVAVLLRELKKKRRHKSVRALFQEISTLLPRLKPCFLMSPLSVAQYLGPQVPPFDLVVFDEASQIPVWDAIGAVGRGRQLVCVGDTKQLPPTSFFSTSLGDEDDDAEVDDLESILDECQAVNMRNLTLDWHYRSRHEHLITFSNHHYYENRLLTFPAADNEVEHLGVEWREVPGAVYDATRSRTNRKEADAVAAELLARLRDPIQSRRTYGIVTFSVSQQRLIEDLLERHRADHPEIEPHFGQAASEAVFVKNLENVQGDERDVIFFSICYGPDDAGKVRQNFGPLNRAGGERRLNVAVTRAREQVVVFSALRPEHIDPARSQYEGPRQLRNFLEYAARGPSALVRDTAPHVGDDFDSPFEEQVATVLRDRGWKVDSQVGCSGYRIDLAVAHVDEPGRYLLGVECDGAMYHSARNARDRDRIRQQVLENLGWRIHRVWSTDWWHDRDQQIARLDAAVEEARRAPVVVEVETAPVDALMHDDFDAAQAVDSELPGQSTYTAAHLPEASYAPEVMYAPEGARVIGACLAILLEAEAPLSLAEATRRIGALFGVGATKRPRQRVQDVARTLRSPGRCVLRQAFLWRDDQDPATWAEIRVPGDVRQPADIPLEELENAARALLDRSVALPREALARGLARVFGFARLGSKVRARMDEAIDTLLRTGHATADSDDTIKLA